MATPESIIRILNVTGHLARPFGEPNPHSIDPLPTDLGDVAVMSALSSYQSLHSGVLEPLIAEHHPERSSAAVLIDGIVGPATEELFDMPRCECPDYPEHSPELAAVGSGSWKRCHGIGDFHCAVVKVNEAYMPSHLRQPYRTGTVWTEVLRRTQQAYDEVGLRFVFVNQGKDILTGETVSGNPQTVLSFVQSSSGWIGLAIVPSTPQSCGSNPIWLRLLATYTGGSSVESVIQQWTSLVKHELGHNCSLGHTGGGQGVMSPYIVGGLPTSWKGDPSHPLLVQRFGGVPIPREEPPDVPEPPDDGEAPYRIPGLTLTYREAEYIAVQKARV